MSRRPWVFAVSFSLWLLLLLLLLALPAQAHKASDAYLQLQVDGRELSLRADIALRDLDRELVLDADEDGQLRWGEIRARAADIAALAGQGIAMTPRDAQGAACAPLGYAPLQIEHHSDGAYAVLVRRWRCSSGVPARALLDYRLFATTDPTHRGILLQHGQPRVLPPGAPAVELSLDGDGDGVGVAPGLWGIFRDGVHHIWIGVDHILFLTALLLPAVLRREGGAWLPARSLKAALLDVLAIVTAFTVAHSITLALAVFDIVNPPSRWVESLIALSVLLAALNNIRPLLIERQRWRLTFAFGLVHGFGFASALKDMGLARGELAGPLVMFNLGVEAGQLAIVAVLVPLAWSLRRWRGYRRWVLVGGSIVVSLLAGVWLVERLFDLQLL